MAIDSRFTEQARSFIAETIKQVLPNANVDGGSGINSVLARGGATVTASLLQEIEHVLTARDISDPDIVTDEDMDLLLANLLVERDAGNLSYGFVNLYYNERVYREFASGLTGSIETRELDFKTITDLSYEPQDYFIEESSGLYYVKVPFVGADVGEEYNVEVGEINQLVNDTSGSVKVYNPTAFRRGYDKQTNEQTLRLAQRSVSTRTPLARDGAIYWLQTLFGSKLRDLLVVGNGDDEMLRDEVYDWGASEDPRFRIGVNSLNQTTRDQVGDAQELHVGGRTDAYLLFDAVNYVQQHVDLFADMTLDTAITTPASVTEIYATFIEGTTGTVAATGKLLMDLGGSSEETLVYGNRELVSAPDQYRFYDLEAAPVNAHAAGASVKVVNNEELTVAEDGDITILPVFQIAEIRLLDPVTFEPAGTPIPETTEDSNEPGWYVTKTNVYDILSARETKSIIIDEKRGVATNQPLSSTGGTTADVGIGGETYTRYTHATSDFTGYQGREITLGNGVPETTRTIVHVLSATQVLISGDPVAEVVGNVDFTIAVNYADYTEHPIRVSYYTNTEIAEAQEFLDQNSKRILCSDVEARMFMPVLLDFTMRYRGDGEPADIRERINEVLKTSAGEAIGESEGAKFEYSDLVSAAYEDGLANYVVTPFQVRVRRLQIDGSWVIQYINPEAATVGEMSVRVAPVVPSTFLEAQRPTSVTEFVVPDQGQLHLGAFTSNQETVEYAAVAKNGDEYTFILKDGETIDLAHGVDEPLRVSTLDYDDANLITDGVITDERTYRPYLGQVVIEKL